MGLFSSLGGLIGLGSVGGWIDDTLGFAKDVAPVAQAVGSIQAAQNSAAAIEAQVQGQRETNATNIQLNQANRDWQQQMSNTAHTREVADYKNAGLNPILSATGGSGASTPNSTAATIVNPYDGYAANVNSANANKQEAWKQAMNIRQTESNVKVQEEEVGLKNAQKHLTKQQTSSEENNTNFLNAATNLKQTEREVAELTKAKVQAETDAQRAIADERASAINVNNALFLKNTAETKHINLDYQNRNPSIEKVTNPAKKVVDVIGTGINSAAGIRSMFRPNYYMPNQQP
ncbi:MAG: DNA pilot protein [Microvirus sp.]|nr:MAG: DNA pilot protein [Microvirus sp.]